MGNRVGVGSNAAEKPVFVVMMLHEVAAIRSVHSTSM